jgi:hypothetical protein
MKRRQSRPGASTPSVPRLAIVLAFGASVLMAPSAAHAGPVTHVLCPGAVTLSGGTAPTEKISVDDDLELKLNGDTFFDDADGFAQDHDPIGFTAEFGDELHVIATNGFFGGPEHIDPLYLTCDANDEQQVLDDTGFDTPDGAIGEVFYDETFTIELGPPQTTITKHPKKRAQRREATFRFASDPTEGAAFECKLDDRPFRPCESPYEKSVHPGTHRFKVRATVDEITEPTPAKFKWRVLAG